MFMFIRDTPSDVARYRDNLAATRSKNQSVALVLTSSVREHTQNIRDDI